MRAKLPDQTGFVERDRVRLHYDVYGSGAQAMLFIPPWSIVHSRVYKAQLPYSSASASAASHTTGAATACLIGPNTLKPIRSRTPSPTHSPSWTQPAQARRSWLACPLAA